MNGKLPALSGRAVLRALERAGFVVKRIKGSHHILVHPDDPTRRATVPVHGAKAIKPGRCDQS